MFIDIELAPPAELFVIASYSGYLQLAGCTYKLLISLPRDLVDRRLGWSSYRRTIFIVCGSLLWKRAPSVSRSLSASKDRCCTFCVTIFLGT